KERGKKGGYRVGCGKRTVNGKLARDASGWALLSDVSAQRFTLEGEGVDQALPDAAPNAQVVVTGDWKTAGEGKEAISPLPAKKAGRSPNENGDSPTKTEYVDVTSGGPLEAGPSPVPPIRAASPGLAVLSGGGLQTR